MNRGRRSAVIAVATATLLGVAGLGASGIPAAWGDPAQVEAPVAVTVDPHAGLGTVPAHRARRQRRDLGHRAGHRRDVRTCCATPASRMLRYPGGSYADIYHWQDHTAPGGYVAPNTDFDTFMASVQKVGAQPIDHRQLRHRHGRRRRPTGCATPT